MTIHIPHINAIDPSRTMSLRNRFVADFKRRFKKLAADIKEAVVDLDVLGLNEASSRSVADLVTNASGLSPKQFDFPRDKDKLDAFSKWLDGKSIDYFFSNKQQGLNVIAGRRDAANEADWMNIYIDSAYQQGIRRGRQELKKAGVDMNDLDSDILDQNSILGAFNTPMHANRLGLIYTRAYTSLKSITAAMDSVISDALAIGVAEGRSPRQIASALNKTLTGRGEDFGILDSLGRFIPAQRRAEILARTEVIRSHHSANIGEYKRAGMLGIKVQVEHVTAGDKRVCPKCEPLNGKIFTIEEAENIIPVHPQCRCVAVPHIPEEETKKEKVKKKAVRKRTTRKRKPKMTEKEKLKSNWEKIAAQLETERKRPWQERDVDKIQMLRKRERKAYYKYMPVADEDFYREEKRKILSGMKRGASITRAQEKAFEQGTDYIPIDLLQELERTGVYIRFDNKPRSQFRAYYSPRHLMVHVASNTDYEIVAHEFAHAIDHYFAHQRDDAMGGVWRRLPNKFITAKEGSDYRKWYTDFHDNIKDTYDNGDGEFYTGNWINNYEGRIYPWAEGVGVEWISMNVQRYSTFRRKKDILYYEKIEKIKELITNYEKNNKTKSVRYKSVRYKRNVEKLKHLEEIGPDQWAMRSSSGWQLTKERHPQLAAFIENKFGGRVLGQY